MTTTFSGTLKLEIHFYDISVEGDAIDIGDLIEEYIDGEIWGEEWGEEWEITSKEVEYDEDDLIEDSCNSSEL